LRKTKAINTKTDALRARARPLTIESILGTNFNKRSNLVSLNKRSSLKEDVLIKENNGKKITKLGRETIIIIKSNLFQLSAK